MDEIKRILRETHPLRLLFDTLAVLAGAVTLVALTWGLFWIAGSV